MQYVAPSNWPRDQNVQHDGARGAVTLITDRKKKAARKPPSRSGAIPTEGQAPRRDSIRAGPRDQRNVLPLALTTLMVTICESRTNVLDHLDDLHTNRRVGDPKECADETRALPGIIDL